MRTYLRSRRSRFSKRYLRDRTCPSCLRATYTVVTAESHLISWFFIRVKTNCRAKSALSRSKDAETSRYTGKKQRIMRSAHKIRISYVEFYCAYYATRNAIKEHALINKYPWKVSIICTHDTFSCGSRHSFVRLPFMRRLRGRYEISMSWNFVIVSINNVFAIN